MYMRDVHVYVWHSYMCVTFMYLCDIRLNATHSCICGTFMYMCDGAAAAFFSATLAYNPFMGTPGLFILVPRISGPPRPGCLPSGPRTGDRKSENWVETQWIDTAVGLGYIYTIVCKTHLYVNYFFWQWYLKGRGHGRVFWRFDLDATARWCRTWRWRQPRCPQEGPGRQMRPRGTRDQTWGQLRLKVRTSESRVGKVEKLESLDSSKVTK